MTPNRQKWLVDQPNFFCSGKLLGIETGSGITFSMESFQVSLTVTILRFEKLLRVPDVHRGMLKGPCGLTKKKGIVKNIVPKH